MVSQMLGEVIESFLQLLRILFSARHLMAAQCALSCTKAVQISTHRCCQHRRKRVTVERCPQGEDEPSVSVVLSALYSTSVFPLLHANLNLHCI